MIRRPPRSTQGVSSAASDVYKRQPPHQVRTAADTASEDNSCGHRRCWTVAASKGLFCLVCVVLVLVAVRFASWTMMAELCCSVDDFVVFFRSIALLVLISPPHQVRTAAHTASEYDSCGHRRCWTAAASKGLFCLVCIVLVLVAVRFGLWTMMAEALFFGR